MRTLKNIGYLIVIIVVALAVVILIWLLIELLAIVAAIFLVICAIYFGYKATLGRYDKNNFIK